MKKQEKQKLRDQSLDTLTKRLEKEQIEATKLRLHKQAGKLKDLHEYKKKRKEIAVITTIMKEKLLLENNEDRAKKGVQ